VAPFGGYVNAAIDGITLNRVSEYRHTPLTFVHKRAYSIRPVGRLVTIRDVA
jgi:hypothetical protein